MQFHKCMWLRFQKMFGLANSWFDHEISPSSKGYEAKIKFVTSFLVPLQQVTSSTVTKFDLGQDIKSWYHPCKYYCTFSL